MSQRFGVLRCAAGLANRLFDPLRSLNAELVPTMQDYGQMMREKGDVTVGADEVERAERHPRHGWVHAMRCALS